MATPPSALAPATESDPTPTHFNAGVKLGAIGSIVGFFGGLLISGVLGLDPTPIVPAVVIAATPEILALGGFVFGFAHGTGRV